MLESFNIRGGGVADNQQVTKQPNRTTARVFQKFSNISTQKQMKYNPQEPKTPLCRRGSGRVIFFLTRCQNHPITSQCPPLSGPTRRITPLS